MKTLAYILLCCFLVLLQVSVNGQETFILRKTIAGSFSDFSVDQLNNIYLLSTSGQLKKLGPSGDSLGVFNEVRRFGKVNAIDVSNPLKILLFYRDFNTVLVLDRFLGKRNMLDLRKSNLFQVKAIGQAFDNGYWVFDEQEARLKRLDESGNVADQFTDFRLLFDSMPSPSVIIDQNKTLYLYDPFRGVYLFDYYGTFRKRIPYTGWRDFTVINNQFFGRDEQQLYRFDPATLLLQTYPLKPSMHSAIKIGITPESFYVLLPDRLEIYAYRR